MSRLLSAGLARIFSALLLSLVSTGTYCHENDTTPRIEAGHFDARIVTEINQDPKHPVHQLIQAARKNQLASDPLWLTLLHYVGAPGKYQSQVDAPWFFMSPRGKHDPQSELEANLVALFADQPRSPMRLTPYCRFVARRHFLQSRIPLLSDLVPAQDCPEFDRYQQFLAADKLTLVFPSAHPNSPSSAFGHTLIRLDRATQTRETRMLNMSLNFAAEIPPDSNPMAYAVHGLSGGFQGKFSPLPYHLKLREYGQIDNRDIWEYPLILSQEQIDAVVRHSYEMLIAYYDYFFFKENCAYHLLSLLDVLYPENRLTAEFSLWTIPIDSVRILQRRGLVAEPEFFPSTSRQIQWRLSHLDHQDIALINQFARTDLEHFAEPLSTLEPERQASILEILSDYRRYRRLNRASGDSVTQMSADERNLLLQRSRLGIPSEPIPSLAAPMSPDQGHGTARASVGFSDDVSQNLLFSFRPAYHALEDPTSGYGDNAAIDFFSATVGLDRNTDKVFLRNFTLLDIQSLEPRTHLFKPISWRTSLQWEKLGATVPTRFEFLGGAGLAYRITETGPLAWSFAEAAYTHDSRLIDTHTAVTSLRFGLLWEPVAGLKLIAQSSVGRDIRNALSVDEQTVSLNLSPVANFSIELEARQRRDVASKGEDAWKVMLHRYF